MQRIRLQKLETVLKIHNISELQQINGISLNCVKFHIWFKRGTDSEKEHNTRAEKYLDIFEVELDNYLENN